MAPLVPLPVSPAGSWWWLRTAANATRPGGASPRAAPPGPPAAARPGSQTTRHSPSSKTGSDPSWAHPAPRARSTRAKGSPGLCRGPGSQCGLAPNMAEGLCNPQVPLSSAPLLFPLLSLDSHRQHPDRLPSLGSLNPLSIPVSRLCPASHSYSCCHCSSLLLGRACSDSSWALGERGGMKPPARWTGGLQPELQGSPAGRDCTEGWTWGDGEHGMCVCEGSERMCECVHMPEAAPRPPPPIPPLFKIPHKSTALLRGIFPFVGRKGYSTRGTPLSRLRHDCFGGKCLGLEHQWSQ